MFGIVKNSPLGYWKDNISVSYTHLLGVDGALLFSQRGKDEVKQTGLEVPVNLKYTNVTTLQTIIERFLKTYH